MFLLALLQQMMTSSLVLNVSVVFDWWPCRRSEVSQSLHHLPKMQPPEMLAAAGLAKGAMEGHQRVLP